jgi:hypothetical protein
MPHDPGGKVKLPLLPGMVGDAAFSDDKIYRHYLLRDWSDKHYWPWDIDTKFILWIGMNPSTAEGHIDDPTIRKEIKFSKREDYERYIKCNVMDYRSTSPQNIPQDGAMSDGNRGTIRWFAKRAAIIIAAWGKLPPKLSYHAEVVFHDICKYQIWCLGKNNDGSPRHPLYLKDTTPFERFN